MFRLSLTSKTGEKFQTSHTAQTFQALGIFHINVIKIFHQDDSNKTLLSEKKFRNSENRVWIYMMTFDFYS